MGNIRRPDLTLEDRWEAAGEVTLPTGVQALVRVPLLRRQMDAAKGWNTAGYISGYRGSPLGTYDKELAKQAKRLAEANIVFNPGLNEDLAATAVWGSQQIGLYPGAKYDGVFGIWYGKGPGVDRSGDVLREWLAMDRDRFYDMETIAIMPMGFCYPGRDPKGGDNPPRPECAPRWHGRLLAQLPNIRLTLLVGQYAQAHYLGRRRGKTMTETVQNFRAYSPQFFPLPHPSWRNIGWRKRQPWFDAEVVPALRRHVAAALKD